MWKINATEWEEREVDYDPNPYVPPDPYTTMQFERTHIFESSLYGMKQCIVCLAMYPKPKQDGRCRKVLHLTRWREKKLFIYEA